MTPTAPKAGDPVQFTATIKNQGAVATTNGATHGVLFKVGGVSVSFSDTFNASLAPGASVTLTANNGPDRQRHLAGHGRQQDRAGHRRRREPDPRRNQRNQQHPVPAIHRRRRPGQTRPGRHRRHLDTGQPGHRPGGEILRDHQEPGIRGNRRRGGEGRPVQCRWGHQELVGYLQHGTGRGRLGDADREQRADRQRHLAGDRRPAHRHGPRRRRQSHRRIRRDQQRHDRPTDWSAPRAFERTWSSPTSAGHRRHCWPTRRPDSRRPSRTSAPGPLNAGPPLGFRSGSTALPPAQPSPTPPKVNCFPASP